MERKPIKYRVKEDGRIVYVSENYSDGTDREYTVWGIGKNGLIHGAGSYIRRDELGIDYTIISKPTNEEFERYYRLIEKFRRGVEEDSGDEDESI